MRRCLRAFTILELMIVIIVITVVLMAVAPLFMPRSPRHAVKTVCISNLKQLTTALILYQGDNGDFLPAGSTWYRDTYPYVKNGAVYRCPTVMANDPADFGYAINDTVAGKNHAKTPAPQTVVTLFESTNLRVNAHDPMTSLVNPGRHGGMNNIGFLDSHVKAYKSGSKIP